MFMTDGWKFRPATMDRMIYNDVVFHNEYQLPPVFAADDIVIDVGSHTGSFAYAAATRGCRNIYSIEPDLENFEMASENLRGYIEKGFVRLARGAVWRSDPNTDELRFDGYHPFPKSFTGMQGLLNTGNGSVIWGEGEIVPKIALDEIVDLLTNNGEKRVRLLKLDCEGAEWPILFTSERLHLIDEIRGEFHEIGGEFLEISEDRELTEPIFRRESSETFTVERLERFFLDASFSFTYHRHQRPTGAPEGLGLFFAIRKEPV
jgi:FkbM family methyltransferase